MESNQLFKFEKSNDHTYSIVFVANAAKKAERRGSYHPNLECLYCDGKRIVATNGHRLHIYTPEECPLPAGLYSIEKKTKTCIYLSSGSNEEAMFPGYPDFDKVLPESLKMKPFASAGVPARLSEVLRGMECGCVNIDYFTEAISHDQLHEFDAGDGMAPIVFSGPKVKSLIMPMRCG